jgi:predicted RNA-binding Zn ribbon-like protein
METATKPKVYELVGGDPALDLVNTLDWRFRESGTEELLTSYADLLDFMVQSNLMPAKQAHSIARIATYGESSGALDACYSLREAAAEAFYARVDERGPMSGAKATLTRCFLEAREHQRLGWKAPHLQWEWLTSTENSARLPLWMLSAATERLLLSEDMERVRACENIECRWLFLDNSKSHTRRWCDMKLCGNRLKARRFKAVHGG